MGGPIVSAHVLPVEALGVFRSYTSDDLNYRLPACFLIINVSKYTIVRRKMTQGKQQFQNLCSRCCETITRSSGETSLLKFFEYTPESSEKSKSVPIVLSFVATTSSGGLLCRACSLGAVESYFGSEEFKNRIYAEIECVSYAE